jgi:hypothetical protein
MDKEWSENLRQQTLQALADCPITYDGFLHLKNIDGSFGKIAITDVLSGNLFVHWKELATEQIYASIDDLIAAGWVID